MTNLPTHDSTPRAIDFPRAYKRMVALQGEINEGLDPHISHLVKLRASQVNGCAYCIDMHVDEALADGIDAKLLHLVATWHEVDLFSPREQAALALTEAVTLVSESHVPRAVWDQAAEHFGEAELGALLWQIIAINSWNRLAIATRTVPESLKPATEAAGAGAAS